MPFFGESALKWYRFLANTVPNTNFNYFNDIYDTAWSIVQWMLASNYSLNGYWLCFFDEMQVFTRVCKEYERWFILSSLNLLIGILQHKGRTTHLPILFSLNSLGCILCIPRMWPPGNFKGVALGRMRRATPFQWMTSLDSISSFVSLKPVQEDKMYSLHK